MTKHLEAVLLVGCCMVGCLVGTSSLAADVRSSDAKLTGMWQERRYSFEYMGFTSTYSCDGLADKLRTLLIAAGARPDASVRAGACVGGFGHPDRFARADLVFYTLVQADDDTGEGAPMIDATWRDIVFSDHRPRDLETGDCELVQQFRANVLPLLTTRKVEEHTTCIPHQVAGSRIDLKFESLQAAQKTANSTLPGTSNIPPSPRP